MSWKFYHSNASWAVPFHKYRWPFVDVLFFDGDESVIWNEYPDHSDAERWPRSAVFPLTSRPYEGLWLPAPCDTARVLSINYNLSTCVTRRRSHAFEYQIHKIIGRFSVDCRKLSDICPFVQRTIVQNRTGGNAAVVVETLILGHRTVNSVVVSMGCRSRDSD